MLLPTVSYLTYVVPAGKLAPPPNRSRPWIAAVSLEYNGADNDSQVINDELYSLRPQLAPLPVAEVLNHTDPYGRGYVSVDLHAGGLV